MKLETPPLNGIMAEQAYGVLERYSSKALSELKSNVDFSIASADIDVMSVFGIS